MAYGWVVQRSGSYAHQNAMCCLGMSTRIQKEEDQRSAPTDSALTQSDHDIITDWTMLRGLADGAAGGSKDLQLTRMPLTTHSLPEATCVVIAYGTVVKMPQGFSGALATTFPRKQCKAVQESWIGSGTRHASGVWVFFLTQPGERPRGGCSAFY